MLHIFESLPSTNDYCLEYAKQHPGEKLVCLAHRQTKGRGRNGKSWESDAPDNLYLSYLRPPSLRPRARPGGSNPSPLSLVVGLTLAQLLESLGTPSVQLKWPNDVLVSHAKIAGILIEGPVIGIGLNLVMPAALPDQPVTALSEQGITVDKLELAQNLIERLEAAIRQLEASGFKPFMSEWARFDCLAGHEITWQNGHSRALGVNEQGGLMLEDGPFVLYSGSVSLY